MSTVQDTSSVSSLFGASATTAAKSSSAETEDRFLSLLVAQLQNQDPLNPLDNAEITSQMAQLSTVQGIENMNATLESFVASMGASQLSEAASLIGHGVLVPGNTLNPSLQQNVVGFELSLPADSVSISILDAAGNEVRSLDLGASAEGVNVAVWDGLASDGTAVPEGTYSFQVDSTMGGETVSNTLLYLNAVSSVSQSSEGVVLNLMDDESVSYGDIKQIF